MRRFLSVAVPAVVTLALLLFIELALRVVVQPSDFLQVSLLEDPFVGHRIAPHQGGHDRLGFRNADVPAKAAIVAIGDSMTYGVSAPMEGAWPQQLSAILATPVYNMGLGGYSPPDYLYLAQHDAAGLKPSQLVVGVFFGNDLLEACWAVHRRAYWAAWRERGDVCDQGQPAPPSEKTKRFAALRDWMSRHSVIYGILKSSVFARLGEAEKKGDAARSSADAQFAWTDPARPAVRTIFNPKLRLMALDRRLPGVEEGLRVTKRALSELRLTADREGARLLVVLIPTKERVYCAYLKQSGAMLPNDYLALCAAEDSARRELELQLKTSNIAYVDVLGPLQQRVGAHEQLYPVVADGHPLAAGYGVIAHSIADALRKGTNGIGGP